MTINTKIILLFVWAIALSHIASSQCTVWTGTAFESDAKAAHVLYGDKIRAKDYDGAYANWKKAYDMAPAADGKRDDHFVDGVAILGHKFRNSTDETEKKELATKIIGLYDQAVECLSSGAIKLSKTPTDQRIGFLRGRQAYDMFYLLRAPYIQVQEVLEKSVEKMGKNVEYIVLDPYAHVIVYQFSKDKMTAQEVRKLHAQLNEIADYNIANNKTYGTYFEQAKAAMNKTMSQIESQVYDCEYFKNKFRPEFDKNKNDYLGVKEMIITLRRQGCDTADAFVSELQEVYNVYVDSINAARLDSFRKYNPAYRARELYDQGKYSQAIESYELAIKSPETSNDDKASYLLAIASIQFRKQRSYAKARSNAYEAAKMRGGWGDPYMLIGDMYATSASSCGSAWNQSLAVLAAIDKYQYARSIDSNVSGEASKRIGRLSAYKPAGSEGHMQGLKEGQTLTVKCWIGEDVKLSYR